METLPKFNSYKGGDLRGTYAIYVKLDGVCVHITEDGAFSKRGKPLFNIPDIAGGYYEAFDTNWDVTVSKARTQDGSKGKFLREQMYTIFPGRDERLFLEVVTDPTEELLTDLLQEMLDLGHEGLVLWPYGDCRSKKPIKVKQEITVDVRVTDCIEGTGKYKGMLGALMTNYGKIGTGFSDEQRRDLWRLHQIDQVVRSIVEASFMEWTKDNKMRHPRFIRTRFDKNMENLEND